MDNISDFFAQPLWLIDLFVVSLRLLKNNFAEEDFTISSIPFGFCVLLLLLSLLLLRLLLPLLLQQHHPALARTHSSAICVHLRLVTNAIIVRKCATKAPTGAGWPMGCKLQANGD